MLEKSKLIVEGRMSGWLSREMPHVFSVWCFAPPKTRSARYAARESISKAKASTTVSERDEADLAKFSALYGIKDYRNAEFYDLLLNTSIRNPKELALDICQHAMLI